MKRDAKGNRENKNSMHGGGQLQEKIEEWQPEPPRQGEWGPGQYTGWN